MEIISSESKKRPPLLKVEVTPASELFNIKMHFLNEEKVNVMNK